MQATDCSFLYFNLEILGAALSEACARPEEARKLPYHAGCPSWMLIVSWAPILVALGRPTRYRAICSCPVADRQQL